MNINNPAHLNTSPPDPDYVELFQWLDEAGLAALSQPTFAVDGFVLAGRTTILCGQAYTGKSIISLDMALCISSGVEWNGQPTQSGLAFYVSAESMNGVKKRVAAWREHKRLDHPKHFFPIGRAVLLDDEQQMRRLIVTIQHQVQRTGTPARLVVFDSLNKCLTNANLSREMPRVLKAAESICRATGAAVLIVHCVNPQGDLRGLGVMPPIDPTGLIVLEGESGSEVVRLRATQVRAFDLDEGDITLRRTLVTMEEMPDQYGKPSTGVVFVRDDSATF